jgi:hypothetical protein
VLGYLQHRRPFIRVEAEGLHQQVVPLGRAVVDPLFAIYRLYLSQQVQHLLAKVGLERLQVVNSGRASPGEHSFYLIESGVAWKHGFAGEQLSQEAAEAPHIG